MAILFLSLLCFPAAAQYSSNPAGNPENSIGIYIAISSELRPYLSPEDFLALFVSDFSYRSFFVNNLPIDPAVASVDFASEEPDLLDASCELFRVEQRNSSDYWIEILFQAAIKGTNTGTINKKNTNISALTQKVLPPSIINMSGKSNAENRHGIILEIERALKDNINMEASRLGGRYQ